MPSAINPFIEQVTAALNVWQPLARARQAKNYKIDFEKYSEFISRGLAVIDRVGGRGSTYFAHANISSDRLDDKAIAVAGALTSLHDDLSAGYTATLAELAHADVFSDYLEMANYLQSEGWKDAAAVIGGSTLEAHLRQLALKHGVCVTFMSDGDEKPKKADTINADLKKAGAYNGLVQKEVTTWLDLRNKAAHGKYGEYSKEQVGLFISGIRAFIASHPA